MPITSTPNVPVHTYGESADTGRVKIKNKWWTEPANEMHAHISAAIKRMRQYQSYRSINYLKFARLYSNMEISSLSGGLFSRTNEAQAYLANRVTYNVIKSCIDTASSKIAKQKPRPFFLTEDGSWSLQERAKLLTKYFQGQFDRMGTGWGEDRTFWGLGRQCFVDACIFGTGAVKLFTEDDQVVAERNFIDEIYVDDAEGRYRQPRQLHQVKLVHREVLLDLYPAKYHRQIMAAPSGLEGDLESQSMADMIYCSESWHLPSGKDAKDGRRCIAIDNLTLDVTDYKKDYFPFLFQRWSLHPLGFYGRGLSEELIGIQLEINKHLRNIQLAQHLCAVPQVWLDVSSRIPGKKINNEVGGIKYYRNTPPIFMTPPAMSPEVYRHLETLYQKAYEVTGISLLSASSQKPAGIDSGKALREFKDIQTERFALTENMYEDFYMDATYMVLDMLRDLVADGKNPKVRMKDATYSIELSFKDVDIPDDKVSIRAYPTNFLPSTPAGKFQTVQEMVQGGFYSQEEALDLLDFPDVAKINRLKLGPRDAVVKVIEYNLKNEGKDYISPEPRMNLEFAAETAQTYLLRGLADGMPEEKLDVLRKFQDQVVALIEQMTPPPPPPPPVPVDLAATMGQPAPPPVSDLMPFGA
jgi:hypothetical protein